MGTASLHIFHELSRGLDFLTPMEGLLGEFRAGRIADRSRRHEDEAIRSHLGGLSAAWDLAFPAFPWARWRRRTLTWEYHRGQRDAYLRGLIATTVAEQEPDNRLVVNPAAVFGRHARKLARSMPSHEIIGTDIEPAWNRLYRAAAWWKNAGLTNFRFVRESTFDPDLRRRPAAVVFFGACGSVTDGCMDYAVRTAAPFLICRSCCHDNIGGNTQIARYPTHINRFFAWKNRQLARIKRKNNGFYFSERYGRMVYPRSEVARRVMDTDTIIDVARNSSDSDICRGLIDLDRCLYLREQGYSVMYREELFFAHRTAPSCCAP